MATIRIEWQPNPASELVTIYKVWESVNGGSFLLKATTSNTFHEIVNPSPNQYSYVISAHNFVGSSPNSDPVNGPTVPTKPSTPTLTIL